MSESTVGLFPAGTGPKARVILLTIGGQPVIAQVISQADPDDGTVQKILAGGYARVKAHGAIGSDGTILDLDSWAQVLNWNADGTLNYVQVSDGATPTPNQWRQTFTYTNGQVTGVSAWVKQ